MKYKGKKTERQSAVALKYSPPEVSVPKIAAKGYGEIAKKIIELARKHNIPIKEDPDLVQILYQLDLNQEIPTSVYKVVAEILAFVYSLNNKWKQTSG
mgnify:CR=1 FL=1|tara:strand:+ start:130 stop:423 length:294 start_codon:yes stop_codon:yes gene_type:complete